MTYAVLAVFIAIECVLVYRVRRKAIDQGKPLPKAWHYAVPIGVFTVALGALVLIQRG